MLALLIALVLAPPSESARVTKPGSTTRLFDTRDSARACVDAMAADLKAELDANRGSQGGLAERSPFSEGDGGRDLRCGHAGEAGSIDTAWPRANGGCLQPGASSRWQNAAKQGWTHTADLARSAAEAAAEQEQQPQPADAAGAAREQQEAEARS
jgi:hypothetical protein